jgi:glycogen debranching enzyme
MPHPVDHQRRARRPGLLRAAEARSKERILTQHEPAKIEKSSDAVVLKEGSVFLVATESGDIPFEAAHGAGLFFKDCRYLDGYALTLNGTAPTVLSAVGVRGFETRHHLTNPELRMATAKTIPKNTIAVRRQRLLRGGVVHELLRVRNYGEWPARVSLELRFRSRFEDMFVLKGFVKGPRGTVHRPRVAAPDRLELDYAGRDGRFRRMAIVFSPAPDRLDGHGAAAFELGLDPGSMREIAVTMAPSESESATPERRSADPDTTPAALTRWLERAEAIWVDRSTAVVSNNPLFDRVLQRALMDLRLLRSRLDGFDYFAAGIPWFATLFGRDAATVALQTLPYGTAMARQTLQLLARHQATHEDAYRDAAPGKILHEYRAGELARLDAIPQSPAYYGTVDATPLFLILLAQYVRWSGDLDLVRTLRPNVDAALGWMEQYSDTDGDGYLDYVGRYEHGLVNQGWKDSGNAIVNADGTLAEPPIALCEVQAYAYRAWRESAALLRCLGDGAAAERLDAQAAALHARFDRDFWSDELGCYVLARQAKEWPAAVVSSNAGQVLWGGLATPERAARVAARLMAPDMFSGWGIRTLSSEAAAYNPMSYHLGSVWPHDNSLILSGLRRYGHDGAALRTFDALFDAASRFRGFRLPELYCGHDRSESEDRPIGYPVACSPQAWAAGSLPYGLWSLLGLWPDAVHRRLHVRRPRLPEWLERIEMRGVRVGAARADLTFARGRAGVVHVDATVREGELEVGHTE